VILYNIALHEELGERNEMNELIEVAGRSLFAPVAFAANPISRIAASKHISIPPQPGVDSAAPRGYPTEAAGGESGDHSDPSRNMAALSALLTPRMYLSP
jgi:hypothetical protein